MNPKLLSLTPKRFLCPYCGEWHKWNLTHELGYYDSEGYSAECICPSLANKWNTGNYRISFYLGNCYYSTAPICRRANQSIEGEIPISSIIESQDKPIVTFDVPYTTNADVGMRECSRCDFKHECISCKLGDKGDKRHMNITFGFEFEQSDYEKFSNAALLARKEKKLQEREQAISSKERALNAVASKEQVSQTTTEVPENKEDTTMTNNILSMNMEFGLSNDENITSTLIGVAVKNGDSWRIYDKEKKEITEVGDMQLGSLPIFILPTTKLSEGDLIKDAGEYYFVTKVATANTPTQTLSARTGEFKNIVPIKNILGFSCYSKVIALSDSLSNNDDKNVENLLIMLAMCGQTGESSGQMNQLLPLLLFKDKLGGDNDKMNLLLMSSMMTYKDDGRQTGESSSQMNQLLPLLLFKDKLGGDDSKTNLLLMSSMMGGNMAGSNNPLMSYLMLDTFIGKKDEKAIPTGIVLSK